MNKTALVLGGTGLIGHEVICQLMDNNSYGKVIVVNRRVVDFASDKIVQVIADPTSINEVADQLVCDDVFCCLGTTQKKAGSRERFKFIDHDYVIACAKIAFEHGAKQFLFISAIGAKVGAQNYYSHIKGLTEKDLKSIGFDQLQILRPSLLLGDRSEKRFLEDIGGAVLPYLSFLFLGALEKYRPIHAWQVATAMVAFAKESRRGENYYEYTHLIAAQNA